MEDLDKIIEVLFSEVEISNSSLKDKLKEEFKDQLFSLFFDTVFSDLSKDDRIKFFNLLKQEDRDECKKFVELHPEIKQSIANFWESRFPVLIQDYKSQVLIAE
jgi:hypothetical protein